MYAQREGSFLVIGHAKKDTEKERDKRNGKTRPVRELQSLPHGVYGGGKSSRQSQPSVMFPAAFNSQFGFSFFFFFFLGSREASYLPNLVGLSNAHFLAFVWLDKVRRPRKSCGGAEAGDVWRRGRRRSAHAGRVAVSQPGAGERREQAR